MCGLIPRYHWESKSNLHEWFDFAFLKNGIFKQILLDLLVRLHITDIEFKEIKSEIWDIIRLLQSLDVVCY